MMLLDVSRWWWDYFLLATPLLAGVVLLGWLIRQPARRIALAWAAALGLAAMVVLCGLPHAAKIHLLPPVPPAPEWTETLEPVAGPFVQRTPLEFPPDFPPVVEDNNTTVTAATQITVIDSGLIASAVLSIGSLLVGLRMFFGAICVQRLCRRAGKAPTEVKTMLQSMEPNGNRLPRLGTVDDLPVAVACGLRRPTILLPTSLVTAKNNTQLRDVLAHELAHVRHRDLWLLALLRLLMFVLWAHPLYWLWRRRVRLDQELLADTAAAELTSRANYAEQLVALARQASETRIPRLATSVGLWETRSQLAKRIAVLLDDKFAVLRNCSRRWRVGSLLALLSLAVGLSMVTLTPAEPREESKQSVEVGKASENPDAGAQSVQSDPQTQSKEFVDERQPNTIVGVCLDENGKPLAGVSVEVYSYQTSLRSEKDSTRVATLMTNAQGEFSLTNVVDIAKEFPDGLDVYLSSRNTRAICAVVKLAGRVPGIQNSLSYDVADHGLQCQLHMPPAQTLTGLVHANDGKPIIGARVAVEPWGLLSVIPGGINSAVTDEEGKFNLNDLPRFDRAKAKAEFEARQKGQDKLYGFRVGSFEAYDRPLWVEHPDYARKSVAIEKIPGRLDVVLQPAGKLTGQVLAKTEDGQLLPVKQAQLSLVREPAEQGGPPSFETVSQRTDAAGGYSIQSLPPGKYSLMAYDAEWVTSGVTGIEVKRGEATEAGDLIMTRGGSVRVQLIDDATGKPLDRGGPYKGYIHAQVFPLQPGIITGNGLTEFSADSIGMRRLAPGEYRLSVSVPLSMNRPGWEDTAYANIRSQEDLDKLPVVTVKEGEVVDVVKHVAKPDTTGVTVTVRMAPPADSETKPDDTGATGTLVRSAPPADEESPDDKPDEAESSQTLEFVPTTAPADRAAADQENPQSAAHPPKLLYLAWLDKNAPRDGWGDITLWDPQGNVLKADKQAAFLATAGESMTYNNEQGLLPPLAMFFEIDPSVPSAVTPRAVVGDDIEIRHASSRSRPAGAINVALLSCADPRLTEWPAELKFTVRYAEKQRQLIKTISTNEPLPVQIADGVSWYLASDRAQEYDRASDRMVRAEGKTAGVLQIRTEIEHGLTNYSADIYLKGQTRPVREAYVTIIEPQGAKHTIRVTDAFDSPEQIDRVEFWRREFADEDLGTVPLLLRLLPTDSEEHLPGDLSDRG